MEPTFIFDDDKEQAEYLAQQKKASLEEASSEQSAEEKALSKPHRGRPRRSAQKAEALKTPVVATDEKAEASNTPSVVLEEKTEPDEKEATPKPRRTRRTSKKAEVADSAVSAENPSADSAVPSENATGENPADTNAVSAESALPEESSVGESSTEKASAKPKALHTRTTKKEASSDSEKPKRKYTRKTSKKADPFAEGIVLNEGNAPETEPREKAESQQMSWGYFQELATSIVLSESDENHHDEQEVSNKPPVIPSLKEEETQAKPEDKREAHAEFENRGKIQVELEPSHISEQSHISESSYISEPSPAKLSSAESPAALPSAERSAIEASPEKLAIKASPERPAIEEATPPSEQHTPMLRPAVVDLLPARPFGAIQPVAVPEGVVSKGAVPENTEVEGTEEQAESSDTNEEADTQQRQNRRRRGHRGGKGRRRKNGNIPGSQTENQAILEEVASLEGDTPDNTIEDNEQSPSNNEGEQASLENEKNDFEDTPQSEVSSEEKADIDSRRRSRSARRKAARRKAAAEASAQEQVEGNKPQRKMFISVLPGELVEVVITEGSSIEEYYVEMVHQAKIRGNIYKGVITNIDPNLQAAFVNFGQSKNGFLQIDEIHPEYWLTHFEPEKGSKYPPIQKVMKAGQEVLVQVVKEPTGGKGAFLTTWVSLAGRFLVLTPGQEQIGVSRKVEDGEERNRLRELLRDLDPGEGVGTIVRTVSAGTSRETLQKDLEYLKRVWQDIRTRAGSEKAPSLIYEEPNLARRSIRDYLSEDISEIWVDDSSMVEGIREMVEMLFPDRSEMVKVYDTQDKSMWEHFNILKQIEKIHSREVILPSGGRLVFDQTEALMAIDINSGKSYGKNNFESTAVRTNLEAAEEIARQLRLRDVGGQIVIDFIEMREQAKCQEVERTIHNAMRSDRARHDIAHMSSFGLMQIVRQRIGSSAISISQEPCPYCGGTGMRRNMEWQALQLLREMRTELAHAVKAGQHEYTRVLEPELAVYILNSKRERLIALEQEFDIRIEIRTSVSELSR